MVCSWNKVYIPGLQGSQVPCRNSGSQVPSSLSLHTPYMAEPSTFKTKSWALLCPTFRGGKEYRGASRPVSLDLNPEMAPIPAAHCPRGGGGGGRGGCGIKSLGHMRRLGSVTSSWMALYQVTVCSLWKNRTADFGGQLGACSIALNECTY